jgi:hypothetical protein
MRRIYAAMDGLSAKRHVHWIWVSRNEINWTRISIFNSRPTVNIHLTATAGNSQLGLRHPVLERTTRGTTFPSPEGLKARNWPSFDR